MDLTKAKISSKTGGAQIFKQGHTATGNNGDDPNTPHRPGTKPVRELNVK